MTKKIITFSLFILFTSNAIAQTTEKSIDSLLVNIDKSAFTSGVLYDRVMPLANLAMYNDSINVANTKYFEQALFELRNASNNQKFISFQSLREHYSDEENYSIVDIGVINADFHQLNYVPDNLTKSALKITTDKFERINTEYPIFIHREALIIAPLKEYAMGNTITFHFDNMFFIENNSSKTISSIIANFSTADNYTIYQDDAFTYSNLNISYTETGYKTLTFVVTYSDGSTKATQAELHVKLTPSATSDESSELKHFESSIPFQGYDEASATAGRLDYRVFYGNPEHKILKPILILDGFDPLDKRKIIDVDSPKPADKHTSIKELMFYNKNPIGVGYIIDDLNDENFDVIIINPIRFHNGTKYIDGGADYIERNGLSHASFIQFINEKLATNGSSEQIVVMGPSMGGLISRYALAYMEKQYELETDPIEKEKWNHNCRLWLSMDSPHLGANISIGVQSLLNQAKNSSTAAMDFVTDEIGSPAARQMLIEQFNGWNGENLKTDYLNAKTISQGYSENRGHPFFIQFYDNLYSNGTAGSRGYPQNLKKIALINGSLTASNDYAYHGSVNTYLGNSQIAIRSLVTAFGTPISAMEAYAMPTVGTNSKISFFKKLYRNRTKYVMNINTRGVMDNTPGSYFSTFDEVAESLESNFWVQYLIFENKHAHTFMPVPSTLGFINPNFNWSNNVGNRNLRCTEEIPFDSYYGEELNTDHISFTESSFNWLFGWVTEEEEAGPPVYNSSSDSFEIEGDSFLCNDETKTYYIEDCIIDGDIEWSVSDNLDIVSVAGLEIQVTRNDTELGLASITATIDDVELFKPIVGTPKFTLEYTDDDVFPFVTLNPKEISFEEQGVTSVVWVQTSGSGTLIVNSGDYFAQGSGSPTSDWYVSGTVTVTNSCGEIETPFTLSSLGTDPCHPPQIIIENTEYDNEYRVIDLCDTGNPLYIDSSEIYDQYGIKIQDVEHNDDKLSVEGTSESGTIRIIKVISEGKEATKRVIVK